ncbi:MAG: sulfotransferase domain-containing protein [Methylococcaceae bacterium]
MRKLEKLFICIGAQKAGTTWLYSVLSKDKRFAYCQFVKEIHYLDAIYNNSSHLNHWRAHFFLKLCQGREQEITPIMSAWLSGKRGNLAKHCAHAKNPAALSRKFSLLLNELDDAWYADLLRLKKGQLCSLDITPDYAVIGADGFAHLARLANNINILFIIRNPVDRAWSGLLQGKKRANGGINGFIAQHGDDIDFLFNQCTNVRDVKLRNDYLKTLEDLESAGIKNNLLVKFYDDISQDPENLISDIYSFIDITTPPSDTFADTLRTKVYETQKTAMPKELELRLKAHYKDMVFKIHTRHVNVPANWLEYFDI